MPVTDMKDFRVKKVEQQYFQFYKHLEQFFEEKYSETDIIERLCFAVRYVGDIANTAKKHIKDGKATESFKTIIRIEDKWLKKIAEVLDV